MIHSSPSWTAETCVSSFSTPGFEQDKPGFVVRLGAQERVKKLWLVTEARTTAGDLFFRDDA